MKKIFLLTFSAMLIAITCLYVMSCDMPRNNDPVSSSGVSKVTTKVATDLNGNTSEQNNIIGRYAEDNKPGAIKHLYILSAYSGDVLIYSTVKGKVTSSGKRLSPTTVDGTAGEKLQGVDYNRVNIAGRTFSTDEVLQDDGTYGSSVEYIYWWDSKGIYHQQYITGGMILHISNQPIAVKSVVLNMETVSSN